MGITSEVELKLADVIVAALANNRDLEVSRISRQKASLNLRAAKGYFDPGDWWGHALRQVSPVASSLGGAASGSLTQKEFYADPQISGSSPWLGTAYKLDFISSRIDSNNSCTTLLIKTYPTSATLNLTQPIWRPAL